jgi:hypothetical protein
MENKRVCENCRRELDIGVDATRIEEGVIGMKGFVPSDKTMFFCSDECVHAYYDLSGLPSIPPRIP